HFPTRRQLKQDWTELSTESIGHEEKLLARRHRIFQLLHVRGEAAAFDGKKKTRRRRVAPVVECVRGGQMIEAVVDLDGIEVLRVEVKHSRGRGSGGIKHVVEPVF